MNERIQELAKQAMKDTSMSFAERWDRVHRSEFMEVYNEKFAELIVRECIRHFNEDYQRDFDTLWREDLTNSIKNHFGVE